MSEKPVTIDPEEWPYDDNGNLIEYHTNKKHQKSDAEILVEEGFIEDSDGEWADEE